MLVGIRPEIHITDADHGVLRSNPDEKIDDANTLGMYLATGAICCMGLFLAQKGWRRWLWLVVMALICLGLYRAFRRSGWL